MQFRLVLALGILGASLIVGAVVILFVRADSIPETTTSSPSIGSGAALINPALRPNRKSAPVILDETSTSTIQVTTVSCSGSNMCTEHCPCGRPPPPQITFEGDTLINPSQDSNSD